MVFDAAQTASFFTDADQMALPQTTLLGLLDEGIQEPSDLGEFHDEDLKQVANNLRKPSGTIPNPNYVAGGTEPARVPRPSYVLGAKSFKRLKVAAAAVRYYETIGRELTPTNMHYENVLQDFGEQWKALEIKAKEDDPNVPHITKALPIVKWTESFEDFLHQVIGVRRIPLAYLVRGYTIPLANPPTLDTNKSYSASTGSVEMELISRATYDHSSFKEDNKKLYQFLEEATRTTQYSHSIRPFSRNKNGSEAYKAMKAQYAGRDKWQSEIKKQENFIHTRVWKGNTNFSLESFITQHRAAHVSLERCAQAVPLQVPNERTRVTHLLDAIQCENASIQAAVAHVKSDETPNGLQSNFERAAAYLIQFDPVTKKRKALSQGGHTISGVSQDTTDSKKKANRGTTGVEFRYYKPEEYRSLTDDQKLELREHRKRKGSTTTTSDDKPKTSKRQKKFKSQVISALQEIVGVDESQDEEQEVKDFIISVVKGMNNKGATEPTSSVTKSQQPTLQSILKRLNSNK